MADQMVGSGSLFTFITTLVSLLAGILIKARIDRTQANTALHSARQKAEFELLRTRLEELHRLLDDLAEIYGDHWMAWERYLLGKEQLKDEFKESVPRLPEPPLNQIRMIVSFYAPELQKSLYVLTELHMKYTQAIGPLYGGSTDTTGLEQHHWKIREAVLIAKNEVVRLFETKKKAYYAEHSPEGTDGWSRLQQWLAKKTKPDEGKGLK